MRKVTSTDVLGAAGSFDPPTFMSHADARIIAQLANFAKAKGYNAARKSYASRLKYMEMSSAKAMKIAYGAIFAASARAR